MPDKNRAGTISPAQLRHLLRVTAATSRHPARDKLVLLLGLTCAMRVTEIARLSGVRRAAAIRQSPGGGVASGHDHQGLRAALHLPHPSPGLAALEAYVELRWAKGQGTEFDRKRYRGLSSRHATDPHVQGLGLRAAGKAPNAGRRGGRNLLRLRQPAGPCHQLVPGAQACTIAPATAAGARSPRAWSRKAEVSKRSRSSWGMRTSTTPTRTSARWKR